MLHGWGFVGQEFEQGLSTLNRRYCNVLTMRDGPAQREAIASSYLRHIILAAEVGDRTAPFRDFLDNWFAFEVGGPFLSRGERPVWFNNPSAWSKRTMMNQMHFTSHAARKVLDAAAYDKAAYDDLRRAKDVSVRLMVDHAVPLGVLREHILANAALHNTDELRNYLKCTYRLGVITHAEDAVLTRLGLRSAMPEGWDGTNVYARYEAAGVAGVSIT